MRNDTHFIWIKATQQCHCITVQKLIGFLAIPIITHSSWQTSGMDIYQIEYDICKFKSLRR